MTAGFQAGFKVVTDALRVEAAKWDQFAAEVEPIHRAVQEATLDITAFFVGEPTLTLLDAPVNHASYQAYQTYMEKLIAGAKAEFPQIADALIKVANKYDEAEKIIELNLNEIYSE
jgi:hypothetical protein